MVDEQPKWRTGKLCYVDAGGKIVGPPDPAAPEVYGWFSDPAGNTLGLYQQPGLAETEAREVAHHD